MPHTNKYAQHAPFDRGGREHNSCPHRCLQAMLSLHCRIRLQGKTTLSSAQLTRLRQTALLKRVRVTMGFDLQP
eukprot:113967-Pelagomonas_calceolata.AAC.1